MKFYQSKRSEHKFFVDETATHETEGEVTLEWIGSSKYTRTVSAEVLVKMYTEIEMPEGFTMPTKAAKTVKIGKRSQRVTTSTEERDPTQAHGRCEECGAIVSDDQLALARTDWMQPYKHYCSACAAKLHVHRFEFGEVENDRF